LAPVIHRRAPPESLRQRRHRHALYLELRAHQRPAVALRHPSVMFRTLGQKVELRATDGDDVLVTLRVGNQCAHERMNLRTTKKAIVFA
jgi:hypothetical protein